jgi:hypothetical protein
MNNTNKNDEIKDKKHTSNIVCKKMNIRAGSVLVCLEEEPEKCKYSLSFGKRHLCKLKLIYSSLAFTDAAINHT